MDAHPTVKQKNPSKKREVPSSSDNKLLPPEKTTGTDHIRRAYDQSSRAKEIDNPDKSRKEAPSHPVDQDSQVTLLQEKMQKNFEKTQKGIEKIQESLAKIQGDNPKVKEEIKQIRQDMHAIGEYLYNIKLDNKMSQESIEDMKQHIKDIEGKFEDLQKLDPTHKSLLKRTVDFLTKDVLYPIVGATIYVALVAHFTKPANALQTRDTHNAGLDHKNAPPYSFKSGDTPISSTFESPYKTRDIPSMRLYDPVQQRPVEVAAPTLSDIKRVTKQENFQDLFLSMCLQEKIVATAVKNEAFLNTIRPMLQNEKLIKRMSDFCQKPGVTEALEKLEISMKEHMHKIRPLVDDPLFQYNLVSALEEHRQEKASSHNSYTLDQCMEMQKLMAPNSPSDNHGREYYPESTRRNSGYQEEFSPQVPHLKPLDKAAERAVESHFTWSDRNNSIAIGLTVLVTGLTTYIMGSQHRVLRKSTKAAKDSRDASNASKQASEDNRLLIGEFKKSIDNVTQKLQAIEHNTQITKNTADATNQKLQAIEHNTQITKNATDETNQMFKQMKNQAEERARMAEQAAAERARNTVPPERALRASSSTIKNRPSSEEIKMQKKVNSDSEIESE